MGRSKKSEQLPLNKKIKTRWIYLGSDKWCSYTYGMIVRFIVIFCYPQCYGKPNKNGNLSRVLRSTTSLVRCMLHIICMMAFSLEMCVAFCLSMWQAGVSTLWFLSTTDAHSTTIAFGSLCIAVYWCLCEAWLYTAVLIGMTSFPYKNVCVLVCTFNPFCESRKQLCGHLLPM